MMNISTIATRKNQVDQEIFRAERVSKVLLELAESHLSCPDNSLYISKDGINKLRKKLNS